MKVKRTDGRIETISPALWSAWVCSEGYDEDGREHEDFESWLKARERGPRPDPTPWQKGDDNPV